MDEITRHDRHASPRRRLGRGLNALLGGGDDSDANREPSSEPPGELQHVDVEAIERNPFQPRKEFDLQSLNELTESIRQHGVLQPLLVRRRDERYQLIVGERRWLAAKDAGLTRVPCRIIELEDRSICEVAIEENLKRRDLNVLEKAQAFRDYLERFGSTVEELSARLSLDRSTVSNYLRLLELSEPVRQALSAGRISNGHARALLPLNEADQATVCDRIQSESLTVRGAEQVVRKVLQSAYKPPSEEPAAEPAPRIPPEMTNHIRSLQDQLREALGAKVEIRAKDRESGKIVISFASNEQFEAILRRLRPAA